MTKFILLTAAAALAFPAVAMADHHGQKGPRHDANGDGIVTTAEVEAQLTEMFAKVDADGNGIITRDEAKAHHQAMRSERRDAMFEKMDRDADGQLSRAEMQAAQEQRAEMRGERGQKRMGRRGGRGGGAGMMLRRADANKDGQITLAEVRAQAMERFAKADANSDGQITAAERDAAQAKMQERRGKRRQ